MFTRIISFTIFTCQRIPTSLFLHCSFYDTQSLPKDWNILWGISCHFTYVLSLFSCHISLWFSNSMFQRLNVLDNIYQKPSCRRSAEPQPSTKFYTVWVPKTADWPLPSVVGGSLSTTEPQSTHPGVRWVRPITLLPFPTVWYSWPLDHVITKLCLFSTML